jgi:ribosomal protein S18 acetylase RimI-like enzyme
VVTAWPPSPLRLAPRRAYILNVYVYPEHRRRGVARKLMHEMLEWCRAERFTAVALHASVDGRALYDELGFTPTNEMRLQL